jgi:hypothetical protein
MRTAEINRLLERYYDGESSEEEELILRRFFEAENVRAEFEAEKEVFRYFSKNAEIPEPSTGFESKIISAVGANEQRSLILIFRSRLITYSGIAAGLLLLFGSYFLFTYKSQPKDTFSNPEIAYAETVKILFNVSSKINHDTRQLYQVGKLEEATAKSFATINKSGRIIENNLKNLDYFQQAIKIVTSPTDFVINK